MSDIIERMSLSITTTVKSYPRHKYADMAEKILGKRYELSLVFIGNKRAQSLNQQYRNKSYSPNVLSFPLDDKTGEIFICPQVAASEAAKYDLTPRGYVGFLFIHGCLHLKGLDHGDTMDIQEAKWRKYFNLK